jgi:hypothetical protein
VPQVESVGSATCQDDPSHVAIVSQSSTGDEPYSHWRPVGEHDVFAVGTCAGHLEGGPLSAQPPLQPPPLVLPLLPPPLLLPLPPLLVPPLLPLLPPPLLLPLPPLLVPPLLPLLPPPLLLPLPPLLVPLLLPLPPSLSVVNVDPPQANDIMASGTISVRLQRLAFIRFPSAKRMPVPCARNCSIRRIPGP